MRISVVIPAFNEEKLLPQTLASVALAAHAFTERGWICEIVVCDNNSTDRTSELARVAGARVVFEPINQIGRARDAGARAATGDWLIFIDADSWPSAELFADIADHVASGRYLGGGSTVALELGAPFMARCFCRCWNTWSRLARWAAGSCVWVEAGAFREAGGFGTEFYAGEEVFLSRRLHQIARARRLKFRVLSTHPLATSARKVRLYTLTESIRFFGRMFFSAGRAAKDRQACHLWYDGRR